MIIVYKHTSPSEKSYIGITKFSIEKRLSRHVTYALSGSKYKFHQAIVKYGIENFTSEILESCDDFEKASIREKYYIKLFNTFKNGYNMTEGGYGRPIGWKHSEETKQKLRNRIVTEETRKKLSDSLTGLQTWNKGKKLLDDQKKNYGHKRTEETKNKLSEMRLGSTLSDETKLKISIASTGTNNGMFGKRHTEESREKIKNSQQNRIWIKNEGIGISKRILKSTLSEFLNDGWSLGMIKRSACLTELVSLTNNK